MTPTVDPDVETAHAFLRRESAAWHAAVEDALAGWDIQTRSGLAGFLAVQARAVPAIEAALDRCGIDAICPDWTRRKRAALLQADLRTLEVAEPNPLPLPPLTTMGLGAGALYVLEGSRLGGKLLARRIRSSGDPRVRAAGLFLDDEAEAQGWTRFRALLNATDVDRQELLQGAELAFACFLAAARPASKLSQLEGGPSPEQLVRPGST